MFSQLTLTVFRLYFTHYTTWNTPLQWNNQRNELEYTKNKLQLFRWRISFLIVTFYTFFIIYRLHESYIGNGIYINELSPQVQRLVTFTLALCSKITVFKRSQEIISSFNQIGKNNKILGQLASVTKWDSYGIFIFVTVIFVPTILPYIATGFFISNSHDPTFIYSIIDTSSHTQFLQTLVFIFFIWFEVISVHCANITFAASFAIIASYYYHASYWLASYANANVSQFSKKEIHKTFQLFTIHTRMFNEAFSTFFLAPMKEVIVVGLIFTVFGIIRYHKNLGFAVIFLLGSLFIAGALAVLALIFPAGWIWKYSLKLKRRMIINTKSDKRIRNSLSPFGIMIGSLYVIKNYTIISFVDILVSQTCSLLIAFKY